MTTTLPRLSGVLAMLCIGLYANAQVAGNPKPLEKVNYFQNSPQKKDDKLSPELRRLLEQSKVGETETFGKKIPGRVSKGIDRFVQVKDGKVIIDIIASKSSEEVRQQVIASGGKVTGVFGRVVSAVVPIGALSDISGSPQVNSARPAFKPIHGGMTSTLEPNQVLPKLYHQLTPAPVPTVYSQGDTAQGSSIARQRYKTEGKGVKVGLLSDSYDYLGGAAKGVENGELPGPGNPGRFKKPVKVLYDWSGDGIDEGRAMAEIVHDVAPGAEIAFHTAFAGMANFAEGIISLAKSGCKIIADDVWYPLEPYFQDGIIAQAVDEVTRKGVTYFSSAGNFADRSYEYNFQPSDVKFLGEGFGTAHNFAEPGAPARYAQPVYITSKGTGTFLFQWDDPGFSSGGAGAETDMDFYLLDEKGNVVDQSVDMNPGRDPFEGISYYNDGPSTLFYVVLMKYSGPNPTRLKYLMLDNAMFYTYAGIPGQFAPTVVGHANSAGAIATAAAWYKNTPAYGVNPPVSETFSALGGTRILLDKAGNHITPEIRRKPDFTGPDGGNNSFFGFDDPSDSDAYPNFFGTSASAPHLAGVAALMIEAQKLNTLSPSQIRGIMSSKTYDMDSRFTQGFDKGFDYNTGTGLVRADQAVGEVKFPNRYIRDLELIPLCSEEPTKTRNWKIVNPNPFEVKAHWFLTGFNQDGRPMIQPGDTYFSTKTAYYRNWQVPNIVILDWEDNFGFSRFDIANSSTRECKNNTANASENGEVAVERELVTKPEIVEVFPNPSTTKFRLYLSLASNQRTELVLSASDGRQLYRNTVNGNGIHEIDAASYQPGIYFLTVKQGDFTKTLRLIKQ